MRAVGAAIVVMALVAGCGGGGGGGSTVAAGAQVQETSGAPAAGVGAAPAAAAPAQAEQRAAQRPDLRTATQAEVADWNSTCISDACEIKLPPRSGRSLNWWGTDPRLVEQVNETCGPQPDCRVTDGDLLVWNFACSPQPACRIRLSRAY